MNENIKYERTIRGDIITASGSVHGDLVIPEGVIEIRGGAFYGKSITSLTLPRSLELIDAEAFYGCEKLRRVNFPEGGALQYIGKDAFAECDISELRLPSSVITLESSAFYGLGSLRTLDLRGATSLEEIGEYAFGYCENLKSVYIGANVKRIGYNAFYSCTVLREVNLSSDIKHVGAEVFEECKSLKTVNIIGHCMPSGWHINWLSRGLKTKLLQPPPIEATTASPVNDTKAPPDDMPSADNAVPAASSLLNTAPIPNEPTPGAPSFRDTSIIAVGAFSGTSITEAKIPSECGIIMDRAFLGCARLETVDFLSNELCAIGNNAFAECTSLKQIELPSAVMSLGAECFLNCKSLNELMLGSLNSIGARAFSGCTSLRSVKLPSELVSLGSETFDPALELLDASAFSREEFFSRFGYDWLGRNNAGLKICFSDGEYIV